MHMVARSHWNRMCVVPRRARISYQRRVQEGAPSVPQELPLNRDHPNAQGGKCPECSRRHVCRGESHELKESNVSTI